MTTDTTRTRTINREHAEELHRLRRLATAMGGEWTLEIPETRSRRPPAIRHEDGRKVLFNVPTSLLPRPYVEVALTLDCLIEHEERCIPDLPDCPPCDQGPMPVELSGFPTPAKRRASECPAAQVEIDCLERSKSRCAGDPKWIDWLNHFKAGPRGLQRDFGCPTS